MALSFSEINPGEGKNISGFMAEHFQVRTVGDTLNVD